MHESQLLATLSDTLSLLSIFRRYCPLRSTVFLNVRLTHSWSVLLVSGATIASITTFPTLLILLAYSFLSLVFCPYSLHSLSASVPSFTFYSLLVTPISLSSTLFPFPFSFDVSLLVSILVPLVSTSYHASTSQTRPCYVFSTSFLADHVFSSHCASSSPTGGPQLLFFVSSLDIPRFFSRGFSFPFPCRLLLFFFGCSLLSPHLSSWSSGVHSLHSLLLSSIPALHLFLVSGPRFPRSSTFFRFLHRSTLSLSLSVRSGAYFCLLSRSLNPPLSPAAAVFAHAHACRGRTGGTQHRGDATRSNVREVWAVVSCGTS